ncbi:MAG: ATP synthase F1 subunit delta [Calditrichia bacterium]
MIGSRVTLRYARALFELARDKNLLEGVESDLNELVTVYRQDPRLAILFESPVIQRREKQKVIKTLFEKKIHPITFYFLNLLIEKKREELLLTVIQKFQEILDDHRNVVRGELITAYEFSDEQLKLLKEKLDRYTGKTVMITQILNPDLLGGFVIRIKDTVIDTSLKNQLARMREQLIAGG